MVVLKKSLESRKFVFITLFIIAGLAFIIKLFLLQVIQDEYKLSADNNVLRYVTQYPPRGVVFDRNGKLMVYNEPAYDLLIVPKQVKAFDTVEFCRLLDVPIEEVRQNIKKARNYSMFKPSIFLEQLSKEDFGYLDEVLFKFPGFFVQLRTVRKYDTPTAAHVLGYTGEVNDRIIERDPYYKMGDYIGLTGLEKSYEPILRGKKGVKIKLVDGWLSWIAFWELPTNPVECASKCVFREVYIPLPALLLTRLWVMVTCAWSAYTWAP